MKREGRLLTSFYIALLPVAAFAGSTYRVSTDVSGGGPNQVSSGSAISGNGRFVAYTSDATNITPFDTNGKSDVFVYDRILGSTERVSVSTNGLQGDDHSSAASISYDGRYVCFTSSATILTLGDTNFETDVFVHDRLTKETTRVSVSTSGTQANDVSMAATISPDGRVVAFTSYASNLVTGDTNGQADVFLRDRSTDQTTLVSVSSDEIQSNSYSLVTGSSVSYDGRYIAFLSHATNLVAGDTNAHPDIFLRDIVAGTTTRVSVSNPGTQSNNESQNPSLSYDGRFVAFDSPADNLIASDTNGAKDVFLRDVQSNSTVRVSVGSGGFEANWASASYSPCVDSTGRFIAFSSEANNFSPQDPNTNPDIYVHDRILSLTTLCSANSLGHGGNGYSERASVSANGSHFAFDSTSTNLIPLDANERRDVFLHDITAELLIPDAWQRVRGVEISGTLGSLLSSDDDKLVLRPGPVLVSTQAPIEITATTTTGIEMPTRIELFVESSGSSSNVVQTVSLLDHSTNTKVVLGAQSMTAGDRTVSVFVLDSPGRFVNGAGQIRAIFSWKASGPTLAYPWQVRIDHIYWTVSP